MIINEVYDVVFPPAIGTSSGPVMSEYTISSGFMDLFPLLVFGTGLLVCLPMMQCSQVAGIVKRLAGIPRACPP